jgi:hypothetical protein
MHLLAAQQCLMQGNVVENPQIAAQPYEGRSQFHSVCINLVVDAIMAVPAIQCKLQGKTELLAARILQ